MVAEFADRLLDEKQYELSAHDAELRGLQETVLSLKTFLVDQQPSPVVAERIKANLAAEWQKSEMKRKPVQAQKRSFSFEGLLRQLGWGTTFSAQRTFALRFAAVAALVVVAIILISPSINGNLTGSAGGSAGWAPLIVVLVFALIAGAVWFIRYRH